jgi:hypothetical protein
MSVYVDKLFPTPGWRYKAACHMVADTVEELHTMAATIGHKREWFQPSPPHTIAHYDLTASRRLLAIKAGAIEIDRHKLVDLIRRQRAEVR